jgi:hypothetical protein
MQILIYSNLWYLGLQVKQTGLRACKPDGYYPALKPDEVEVSEELTKARHNRGPRVMKNFKLPKVIIMLEHHIASICFVSTD